MNYNEKILMILHIKLYTLFNGASTVLSKFYSVSQRSELLLR